MLVGGERITLLQVGVLRVVEHWTKFPEQLWTDPITAVRVPRYIWEMVYDKVWLSRYIAIWATSNDWLQIVTATP
jgi:hypothetical protein